MATYVYLITDETLSDDGKNSLFSKMAVKNSAEAFKHLQRIVDGSKEDGDEIRWSFLFDKCSSNKMVTVVGTGNFIFDPEVNHVTKSGIRTITIEEIWMMP